MQIGLFYGSTTCYTEMVAEKIQHRLGAVQVELHNLKTSSIERMLDYPILILGISTWDFGEIQEDWLASWDAIDSVDLSGKVVALFGLGDQQGYGEWFLDAMGLLHDKLVAKGCQMVGYWPNEGYEFEASKALVDEGRLFVGLALDETNQYALTDDRLDAWLPQVLEDAVALL
ncbi:flavodoxin FldB [Pseudaeromonas paramecii]|uniref:Flavodoxin n=1 Tax=Pseudaeromonas paramecii TaxID=2138166 RepID=A0ABP8Q8K7_9GAMM